MMPGRMKVRTLACALTLSSCVAVLAADRARPNIVVLVADDWGFSDVGSFGSEISTPNIDELARHGVRFANFHAAASCAPTRSMLLTGVDNHLNGVGNLFETMPREHLGKPGYLGSLDTNVVTVVTLLKDSGYRTYITGKWNVGSEPYNRPDQRGFDRSIIQGDTGSDNWVPTQRYLPHKAKVDWFEDGKDIVMPEEYYSSTFFVDRMIEYLRSGSQSGKPFFAYVGFQANHVPVLAPREFIDKYKGRYKDGWTAMRKERRDRAAALGLVPAGTPMVTMSTTGDWNALSEKDKLYQQREMEVYAGMADAMDYHAGRLIAHLKQSGEYDNTVFVFLSDNGAEGSDYSEAQPWLWTQYTQDIDKLGGKGAYGIAGPGWASVSVAPLNTYKFYSGEGGIRTPMIISGVPGIAQNQVHLGMTHVTDIVPTLLDLAQVANPGQMYPGKAIEPLTGRSLLPVLQNPLARVHASDEVIGYELAGNMALYKGDLKIVKNSSPMGDGQWHLHDLKSDPGETRDLQGQMPEVFQTMRSDYEAWSSSHHVLPMPEGYNPVRTVMINTFLNYWIPAYGKPVLIWFSVLAALLAGMVVVCRRRRKP